MAHLAMLRGIDSLEDEGTSYRWEGDVGGELGVVEDIDGNIVSAKSERDRSYRAKSRRITSSIRRGLIRYVVVALDASGSAGEQKDKEFRPTPFECIRNVMKDSFISEFFDQNPISQLSLVIIRDGVARGITELSGNPKSHKEKLDKEVNLDGEASLENTISAGIGMLKHVPDYGSRELLIVFSSLKTRDPGNIFAKIEEAKRCKIRISVICLAAELYICRKIAEDTGGSFNVAIDSTHFRELLLAQTIPPPDLKKRESMTTDFVYMGFPKKTHDCEPVLAADGPYVTLTSTSYKCPRCYTRATELPTQCSVCRLQLNQSSHIARSHHHLFPVPNFVEVAGDGAAVESGTRHQQPAVAVPAAAAAAAAPQAPTSSALIAMTGSTSNQQVESESCGACLVVFRSDSMRFQCPSCSIVVCVECDLFIHDSLHNCPGC